VTPLMTLYSVFQATDEQTDRRTALSHKAPSFVTGAYRPIPGVVCSRAAIAVCIWTNVGRYDSGPPWQRIQANTASLLLQAGRCIVGPPPVKRHMAQWCASTFG